jgi:predicted DNA binding CopG/RHH family protein
MLHLINSSKNHDICRTKNPTQKNGVPYQSVILGIISDFGMVAQDN